MSDDTNKFGPGWRAWWKGDEVGRAMKSAVSQGLRAMAYETRRLARDSIIRRGWGDEPVEKTRKYKGRMIGSSPTITIQTTREIKRYKEVWRKFKGPVKGKYRLRMKDGQQQRLTRVRVYKRSKPGETPTNQRNILKGSILYGFREQDGLISANTGPIAMTGHWSMTNGLATHALEYGGWTRNHAGKSVHIAARPFMRPAAAQVVQSDILKRQLSNSLIRYWAKGPVGSGWTSA